MSDAVENELNSDKTGAVFDFDGYFVPAMNWSQDVPDNDLYGVIHSLDSSIRDMYLMYYLMVRSALIWTFGSVDIPETAQHQRTWAQSAQFVAAGFTIKHLRDNKVVPPNWLAQYDAEIRNRVCDKFAEVNKVQLTVNLEARLQARAFNGGITISVLTREFLRHLNIVLWNIIFAECESKEPVSVLGDEYDCKLLSRAILPHLIYLNDQIHIARLPIVGAHSARSISCALRTTELQTQYILAHEYGHLALDHVVTHRYSNTEHMAREVAADKFAIETMLSVATDDEAIGDLWLAIRWLMQYQMLDEIVGGLLRGREVSLETLHFEQRKNQLYSSFPFARIKARENVFEIRGSVALMSLKAALLKKGSAWLQGVAATLSRPLDHEVVPWWEEI